MKTNRQSNTTLYFQKEVHVSDLPLASHNRTIGIHGIQGSFTDEAWHQLSTHIKLPTNTYKVIELVHAHRVLDAVNKGEVDMAIIAYANSRSGGYVASIEALGLFKYTLLGLFTMPINMCLLTNPKVSSIDDIKVFFGHPVAISQCRKTLATRWPHIQVKMGTDEMDTALSAKLLASGAIQKNHGIFASKRAAQLYGLKVLYEGVHDDPNNATSFALVSRK